MTKVYFVRHAQSLHQWDDDRTRPLTDEGSIDSEKVIEVLKPLSIDVFYSSPYKRCLDTIKGSVVFFGLEIFTDERFRERKNGNHGNKSHEIFRKRWADFNFCEEGGENLKSVQERNIEALFEVLEKNKDKNIVIGTHGTALSTILNYFEPSYGCDDFLRIIDYMPYIIRLDFDGASLTAKEELLIIEKVFNTNLH